VPVLALVVHALLAWSLALGGSFDALALVSGGSNCLVYLLVSIAAWQAQRMDLRERGQPFVLWGGPLIPFLAVAAMVAIVTTLTSREWQAIGIALVALVLLYGMLRALGRKVRRPG
jgi:L-asparagine transporter-like permease